MVSAAGIIAAIAASSLLVWWLLTRPMRGCACGRCRKAMTPLPRCVLSGPDALGWIEFRTGPMGGRRVPLGTPRTTIGSVADNDIVLSDPAVSQRHLLIERKGRSFTLCDLGSTNGVYVNGVQARQLVLAAEDAVQIGNSEAVILLS